jgi:uncharacterized membrane protein
MAGEKGLTRYIWLIIVILSLVLIAESLIFMSMSYMHNTYAADYLLKMSGSSQTAGSLEGNASATFSFMIRWAFMCTVLFGIFGLFCAWGIKRKERFAWKLGILWGVLLIVFGIIIAVNELFILGWSTICPDVLVYLIAGVIALGSFLVVRKEFS